MENNNKTEPENRGINITPILNHILRLDTVKTEDEFEALVIALRELDGDPRFSFENMAKLMQSIQSEPKVKTKDEFEQLAADILAEAPPRRDTEAVQDCIEMTEEKIRILNLGSIVFFGKSLSELPGFKKGTGVALDIEIVQIIWNIGRRVDALLKREDQKKKSRKS